jgi:5-hydroxyisourate hydrolase-like protein (transthyretin family)
VRQGNPIVVTVRDGGSGVDPATVVARVDGKPRTLTYTRSRVAINTEGLARGRHRLRFQVSDYQETRNMENAGAVLPNTRRLTATITITS